VPPGRCKATRRRLLAITPDGGTNARVVSERSVDNEVNAGPASTPPAGPLTPYDGLIAEAGSTSLRECDDAIVSAQIFVEHP
jgi:hypothetical protein